MKRIVPLVAACVLAAAAPALAAGTVLIQHQDGSTKTYSGVTFAVADKTLTVMSPDKVSTVAISGADCAPAGSIVRCSGGAVSFHQDGRTHVIPVKAATFYFNTTDAAQPLPLSTTKIAPHSVTFAVETAKGTSVTGTGTLDKEPAS